MRRVLIVEDEPLIADLLASYLEDLGFAVVGPAASIEAAMALVEREALDFAILDITLGGRNCGPIADRLSQRNVPFAFATGYGNNKISESYKSARILAKPYSFTDVKSLMETNDK